MTERMTTKRFTILYGLDEDPFDWDILDNEKDAIICQYNGTPICELLNELHEENERLLDVNVQCCNDYSAMRRDVLRYKEENEQLKQYKQASSDVLRSWSQKNLTAKQLQVVIAIMEELNILGDVE